MKFLCVACDEPMKIRETRGPDNGSMAIVYRCGLCHRDIAMLTNSMETQMVRSLGVKIGAGGHTEAAEPMEMLRSSLSEQRAGVSLSEARPAASKCPFTGVVTSAFADMEQGLAWDESAQARLAAIPEFVRPMVKKSIEEHAREKGYREINASVMDEVKGRVGM